MNIGISIIGAMIVGGLIGGLIAKFNTCDTESCPLWSRPWRGALLGCLVGGLIVTSYLWRSETTTETAVRTTETELTGTADNELQELQDAGKFEKLVLTAEKPVLVDFYAEWCGPCQQLIPILKRLAVSRKDSIDILKVNVERFPDLARKYGVRGIPHLIIFIDGTPRGETIGMRPEATLEEWIDRTLNQ